MPRPRLRRDDNRDLAIAILGARNATELHMGTVIADHVKRVLEATDGNLSLAADLLGLSRRTMQRHARGGGTHYQKRTREFDERVRSNVKKYKKKLTAALKREERARR